MVYIQKLYYLSSLAQVPRPENHGINSYRGFIPSRIRASFGLLVPFSVALSDLLTGDLD